ncbi:hypothetical protein RJ640_001225 [Escallonia rubra]|uniref:Kinetochore protein SPC25 n=1 Tax=Escallonia rubra TaxID=112253 RepID=A0AA88U8M9_9ASTE|nr:hypothetical protein RJ640_001225 [Escallonia rubra]
MSFTKFCLFSISSVFAVKTRKEAKRMATMDTIAATKARIEEMKTLVEDRRARTTEYATIISQQIDALAACEVKREKDTERREEIEEAISWYNKVLGFRIESGHGVKFVFTNINLKNPKEEYCFTIRHENNVYSLLDCDPLLNATEELISELNKNNGLFKFVRTMREKFQEAAGCGTFPQVMHLDEDLSTISVSASVPSVSTDSRGESPTIQKELQPGETNRYPKKVNKGREGKPALMSPASASYLRRSPRFKVKTRLRLYRKTAYPKDIFWPFSNAYKEELFSPMYLAQSEY